MVRSAYHTFNFITGYKKDNPKSSSLVWRLIVLESLAGCPGMVGASIRHLRSLRHLERDHGIYKSFFLNLPYHFSYMQIS